MGEISAGYKTGILILLVGLGAGIFFILIGKDTNFDFTRPPAVAAGTSAPDFSFPDLDGKIVNLSDYRGKLVLLNIWATWCRPCVSEMPSMERLYSKFKKEDFEILAVSIDIKGKKVVAPFMELHNLSFKALLDTQGTIQETYQATGIPESFIIDKNGVIIEKVIGPLDWSSSKVFQYFQGLLETPQNQKK
jgi:cytochrome c biogenesis protein CcmG/thiol:disulfide interchange protein DsbE